MSRKQERIRRKLEQNPAAECNKIRQKYCPELFQDFSRIKDPRHPGYTKYSGKTMLGTVFIGSRNLESSRRELSAGKILRSDGFSRLAGAEKIFRKRAQNSRPCVRHGL